MSPPAYFVSLLIVLAFAGVRSASAQVNPRVPPPPPPAEPPAASAPAATPPAAGGTSPAQPPATSASSASQPIDPTVPPPPPTDDASNDASNDSAPDTSSASGPGTPAFDPLHAGRSIEIGKFYMNKGAYDAAIDRFVEASNYQPSLAAPWKLLGEAYEKKHDYAKAIDAYNKYLQVVPRAGDAAKIKKAISDLEEKAPPDSSNNSSK